MYEVIRWATLIILWGCIGLNLWTIVRGMRLNKRLASVYDEVSNCPHTLREISGVVHCRECVFAEDAKINDKGFRICPASGMEITDHDYCSYGELKGG